MLPTSPGADERGTEGGDRGGTVPIQLVAFVNEILGRLFVASGDDGGFSFFNAVNVGSPLGQADVAFFASDPNVLAFGGTNLVLKKTFTRAVENAWSGSTDGNSGGSGGGISNI